MNPDEVDLRALELGASLPPLCKAPITKRQLVEYAGASLDFNPLHYDEDFARAAGFPTVVAHGMLSMAFFGEAAARWCGGDPTRIQSLTARFRAVTAPGDVVTISGTLGSRDETHATVALEAHTDRGVLTLQGTARIRLRVT